MLGPIFGPLGELAGRDTAATATLSPVAPHVIADEVHQPDRSLFGRAIYRMQHRETESFGISGLRLHPDTERHGIEQSASDPLDLMRTQPEMSIPFQIIGQVLVVPDAFVAERFET
jgi:hypothetical protein